MEGRWPADAALPLADQAAGHTTGAKLDQAVSYLVLRLVARLTSLPQQRVRDCLSSANDHERPSFRADQRAAF
jgi:hypothetical protein